MKIILDANFLIYIAKYKIDLFSELDRICYFKYRIIILDKVLEELKKINNQYSKLALRIIKDIKPIKKQGKDADSIILEIADKGTIVATQDKELKSKLRKKSVPTITIRQKKYLTLNPKLLLNQL